jgi:DNA-binding response OmpR family regulator
MAVQVNSARMRKVPTTPSRILIIEDDPETLSALNIVLGSVGFDVDVLLKGDSILRNQFVTPDVFLIDKWVPEVDALDICRYLKSKANYRDIPVIILSASPEMREKALEVGADDFLEKPFLVQDLVDLIYKALEKKNQIH